MKTPKERFLDWFMYTDVFEMAYHKRNVINIIRTFQEPLLKNIISLMNCNVQDDYQKLIDEINKCLYKIMFEYIVLRNGKLSPRKHFELLWEEPRKTNDALDKILNNKRYIILKKLYETISYDLSQRKFNGIENYLYILK